jgi:hypothetical protein
MEAGHMQVAVLLRAYGGELGPSARLDLMSKFDAPGVLSVKDVRRQVNGMIMAQARSSTPPIDIIMNRS